MQLEHDFGVYEKCTYVSAWTHICTCWQGSLGGPSAPPFHKHSSVQKLKEAVIDNMKKVVSSPKQQQVGNQDCSTCRPGDAACADHVEPLLPELLRRQSRSQEVAKIKEELHTAAMAYVPISHLMWGLWGLIQAKTSNCEYDFVEYSRQRLQQYHITKPDTKATPSMAVVLQHDV